MNKKTVNLETIAAKYQQDIEAVKRRIILCAGTGCVANGALEVRDELVKELKKSGLDTKIELNVHDDEQKEEFTGTYVSKSGCQGFCQMGPLFHIEPDGILYTKVKVDDIAEIVQKTILGGELIERLLFHDPASDKACRGDSEIPFYNRQQRVVLANCMIEPDCINEYIFKGGYEGARNAVKEMTSAEVCENVLASGLRGRGGGGFPTGLKWKFTLAYKNEKKYVICNEF